MKDSALHLLNRLADGRWHGGPALSAALGVSRAAITSPAPSFSKT